MKKLLWSANALFTALVLSGCATDGFTSRQPKLLITADTDGQGYASVDDETRTINVGEVPVYASKSAVFRLENPTPERLFIEKIELIDHAGERFIIAPLPLRGTSDSGWPKILGPNETTTLDIAYAPLAIGNADFAKVAIYSNAQNSNDGVLDVNVQGTGGTPIGAPDIEVAYNAYAGPASADCATSFSTDGTPHIENDGSGNPIINICRIPVAQALDFGNIGLGATGTVRLRIRNKAECPAIPGVGSCQSCELVLDKNPAGQNIGIGFAPGTNDAGLFAFAGSTTTPARIRQANVECGEDGEVSLSLVYHAPTVEGAATSVIVIESNDPNEPLLEIPVRAFARNAPIAIAKFSEVTPTGQPFNSNLIEPLETIHFDGQDSYDPADPTNPAAIVDYRWEIIEFPAGTNPTDFQAAGQGTSLFSMHVPLAGHYVVKLTVKNADGIESGDTAASRVEFDAVPSQRVHVQLVWDHPTNDQDLHLSSVTHDARVCNRPYDCYYSNKQPVWFAGVARGTGPNPSLDIDDTDGLGPENINIDEPNPGTYRVYVHNYRSDGATSTRCTVRIYIDGVQRAEYRRTLTRQNNVWAVADIIWLTNDTSSVSPYPSDTAGEVGAVAQMASCTSPGFVFP